MRNNSIFRDMKYAPKDGSIVEVWYGLNKTIGVAYWAGQNQAWVLDDDLHRTSLLQVEGWRPVKRKPSTAP